jgi:Ca2+-binding EF-hand superfamily protein
MMLAIDQDNCGAITWDEFVTAAIDKAPLLSDDNILKVFKLLDENGDGVLTIEEFKKNFEPPEEFEEE